MRNLIIYTLLALSVPCCSSAKVIEISNPAERKAIEDAGDMYKIGKCRGGEYLAKSIWFPPLFNIDYFIKQPAFGWPLEPFLDCDGLLNSKLVGRLNNGSYNHYLFLFPAIPSGFTGSYRIKRLEIINKNGIYKAKFRYDEFDLKYINVEQSNKYQMSDQAWDKLCIKKEIEKWEQLKGATLARAVSDKKEYMQEDIQAKEYADRNHLHFWGWTDLIEKTIDGFGNEKYLQIQKMPPQQFKTMVIDSLSSKYRKFPADIDISGKQLPNIYPSLWMRIHYWYKVILIAALALLIVIAFIMYSWRRIKRQRKPA